MKTIIAEKPSVAREIARIVGAIKREEGYFEGGGHAVTWALKHLAQLAMPDSYSVHGSVRGSLSITPDTFTLIPRQVRTEKGHRPDSGAVSQIKIIKKLFDTSKHITVATDTGREGELISRYLYHYTGRATPFVRLRISSLTDKTIREGLRKLEDGSKYDNLYLATKTRNESDWLVDINGTQTLLIIAGYGTHSVERVQTPALAMVCECYWESRRFTSGAFRQLHVAAGGCNGEVMRFSSSKKWKKKEPAVELYNRVKAAGRATVTKAERRERTEETPLLYDLTTLQKEANARHDFTAEQMSEIVQKLYEEKLTAYPRTGSRYTPEDVFTKIPRLLISIGTQPEWKDEVRTKAASIRHGVDGGKITDHHALLITDEKPLSLSREDNTIYQIIVGYMVEAFSEKCVENVTVIAAGCAGVGSTVKGSVMRQTGWRAVYGEEKEEIIIPGWQEGDTLTPKGSSITGGKTKLKSLHTEATLLPAMEAAGKEIKDGTSWQAMKNCGASTPATRVSIIETLFKCGYMEHCKKSLVPIEKGLTLSSIVKTTRIADVIMTGEWERGLARIEHGKLFDGAFRKEIEAYTHEITSELISYDKPFGSHDSGYAYPRRGTGEMRSYDRVVHCDNMECGLPVFRLKAGRALSDDEIKDLLTEGYTELLKGFKSKQGKSFGAVVAFDGEHNTTFVLPETKKGKKFSGQKKQY